MFQFDPCEKIIIFGSSKNLITANYWKKKEGHAWIMINHAWQIREKNNDWDKSDKIRQELNINGWNIKDTPNGPKITLK